MPAASRTTTGAAHSIILDVSERFGFWLAPVFFVDVPSDGAPSAGAPLFFILVMRHHEALGRAREGRRNPHTMAFADGV